MINNIIPIITCVNMSDFLSVSINYNRNKFRNYVVLTSVEDSSTKSLCKKHDVDVIEYDKFFRNAKFNKSGGLNHAQRIIHRAYKHCWILLMDSDIVLRDDFEDVISQSNLTNKKEISKPKDKSKLFNMERDKLKSIRLKSNSVIYGIDRYDVYEMKELFADVSEERKYDISHAGYFQLYFDKSKYYPSYSVDASGCDLTFKHSFPRRQMLESHVFHLGRRQLHWEGRSCERWN